MEFVKKFPFGAMVWGEFSPAANSYYFIHFSDDLPESFVEVERRSPDG